jgi:rod shape-determining protein MreD
MTPAWNESYLRVIGRWGLMLGALCVLLLLSVIPFHIAHLGEIRPAFMLMAVYYWTILRPPPPIAVFATGLLLDLLSSYWLGINALILVVAQWLTGGQRKFLLGQSFLVIWAGFALVALGAGVVQWIVFSLFDLTLVSVRPMLVSTILSAFLFPVVVVPLAAIHKALADDPSSVA